MTATVFERYVIPHIQRYKPGCRVIIFDYASSHVTPGCRAATVNAKYFDLVIPASCTSFLQALDVAYFGVYRRVHGNIVDELIRKNGVDQYKKLSVSDVRLLLAQITTLAHEKLTIDVEHLFRSLGYINPKNSVITIPHLSSYDFQPISLNEEWVDRQRRVMAPVTITPADMEQIVEKVSETPLKGTQQKRPREPQQEHSQSCTCGHGQTPGRHKRHCARHATGVSSLTKKVNRTLDEWATPKPSLADIESPIEQSPIEEPPIDIEDQPIDIDRVVFPDGEEVVFLPIGERGLWDCYQPGTFIDTRTLSYLTSEISEIFLGDIVLDPVMFLRQMNLPPDKVGMKVVVLVHFKNHYATFGYNPFSKRLSWYDSLVDYYAKDRIALYKQFELWLRAGGNEIAASGKGFGNMLQSLGSNDCGIFAINHALLFLSNGKQMGAISREQFRHKFEDRSYVFHYFVHRPEDPLPAISTHVCESCGVALRQMTSRTGVNQFFWGCPNALCSSPRTGPWRMAFD